MRIVTLLVSLAWLSACATGNPSGEETEFVTRIGVITGKEVVELDQVRRESRVSTGVSASVSSGSGLSIGIGFLLSPLFSSKPDKEPVRYEVELTGGDPLTVYHDSDQFLVGDCVEVTSLVDDEDDNPPMMKRIQGGC